MSNSSDSTNTSKLDDELIKLTFIESITTDQCNELKALIEEECRLARIDTAERLLIGSLDYDDFVARATKMIPQKGES